MSLNVGKRQRNGLVVQYLFQIGMSTFINETNGLVRRRETIHQLDYVLMLEFPQKLYLSDGSKVDTFFGPLGLDLLDGDNPSGSLLFRHVHDTPCSLTKGFDHSVIVHAFYL